MSDRPEDQSSSTVGGGCPMHAGGDLPRAYGSSELTYGTYLKVEDLLSLQIPQSEPAHHDEMLFIIIHQAYELWFKLILHEVDRAITHLDAGETLRAHHFLKRVNEILRLLVQQIHILETMTPADFLEFRDRLNPASGFQSAQFRELEFAAGLKDERYYAHFRQRPEMMVRLERRMKGRDLKEAYYGLLTRLGLDVPADAAAAERRDDETMRQRVVRALMPIYQRPESNLPLYLLSEALVDFDQQLGLWREHHVRVVERVIGFKRGTGGSSGVGYLRSTTQKKAFPLLWEVRSVLEKPAPH
jgi:tryptophan 2,3-dioxygenase